MAKDPAGARRDVAERFARAIFHGQTAAAVALLVHPDPALSANAVQAAAPWKHEHASIRFSTARAARAWVFAYTGIHPRKNGGFEEVRGDIVVVVNGSRVAFFTLRNKQVKFRTHHDSLLLPSNR